MGVIKKGVFFHINCILACLLNLNVLLDNQGFINSLSHCARSARWKFLFYVINPWNSSFLILTMVKLQTSSTDIFRSVDWNVDWVQYMYVLSLHQLFVHYLVSQCSHVASLHVVFTVLWLNSHMLNLTLACRSYLILGRWLSSLQYKTVQLIVCNLLLFGYVQYTKQCFC